MPALTSHSEPELERETTLRPAQNPGPPPSGVRMENDARVSRIVVGASRRSRTLAGLFWLALPLGFGALAYQIEPLAGYVAAGMATLFVMMVFGVSRLMDPKASDQFGAICLDEERIWVERPGLGAPEWVETARTALVGALAPGARRESLPLESMPRAAVVQVRVDTHFSQDSSSPGRTPHARLLIEAEEARLEYIGTQFDAKKLEWVRDYLRFRLTGGE